MREMQFSGGDALLGNTRPHPEQDVYKRQLNTHFGTLAGGLGSFPFDCPTYLVQSDSRSSSTWHSVFDILW